MEGMIMTHDAYQLSSIITNLDAVSKECGGITVSDLEKYTAVHVFTRSGSRYTIVVVDSKKGTVVVEGTGSYCKRPTRGYVLGSTLGGEIKLN